MKKRGSLLEEKIEIIAKKFLESSNNKDICIISHFDTDGITSATIMIKTIKKIDKKFSLKIVKNLEEKFIYELPKDKLIIFLDLGSGSLHHIKNSGLKLEEVFIIDHHEIPNEIQEKIPKEINIINPMLYDKQKISASCLTYLFCRQINPEIKHLAKLAILGMIGDTLEKNIDKLNNEIINDGELKRKRGLLIYPSTRPINRALEFSSNPYIPKVTGDINGVRNLLKDAGLNPVEGKYKTLLELNKDEMSRLITAILLREPKAKSHDIVGDIFLIKFFNKLEDAREISAMINACSRMEESETAIQLCMEIPKAKKKAESIHTRYRQFIISGMKIALETQKTDCNGFVIINAKDKMKDTIVGTIASILSNSSLYEEGTIIITMAHFENKIKISSRCVGKNGRNVREILNNVIKITGGEVGGHEFAAGGIITQEKEQEFIKILKKNLEVEVVKV